MPGTPGCKAEIDGIFTEIVNIFGFCCDTSFWVGLDGFLGPVAFNIFFFPTREADLSEQCPSISFFSLCLAKFTKQHITYDGVHFFKSAAEMRDSWASLTEDERMKITNTVQETLVKQGSSVAATFIELEEKRKVDKAKQDEIEQRGSPARLRRERRRPRRAQGSDGGEARRQRLRVGQGRLHRRGRGAHQRALAPQAAAAVRFTISS